ncbi:MAG: Holliday junction resolvase RuvX [Clostridiales bacterium]|nr:Holliday junction resolvase RuvX [Clostridiales bacterium]
MQYKRIMCLDYGDVRIGIAFSDLLQIVASPYETYTRKNLESDLAFFADLCKKQDVETIVIGLPYNMDGTSGERNKVTKEFGALLSQATGLDIVYVDERLSSVEAEDVLAEAKVPAIKRKGLIDKIAASIILQTYLNSKN